MSEQVDVVVIGAGLAGLRCAAELESAGVEVALLEESDGVGGRVRTDRVDDFLCDRRLPAAQPGVPRASRGTSTCRALGLQAFDAGVAVRRADGLTLLGDPRRARACCGSTLTSGMTRPKELAGLGRFLGPALAPPQKALRADDERWPLAFDRAGVDGPCVATCWSRSWRGCSPTAR